jgi:hypothetical protein
MVDLGVYKSTNKLQQLSQSMGNAKEEKLVADIWDFMVECQSSNAVKDL